MHDTFTKFRKQMSAYVLETHIYKCTYTLETLQLKAYK